MTTRSAARRVPSASATPSAVIAAMRASKTKLDALGAVPRLEDRGDLGGHAADQEPRQRLDDGDLGAEPAGGGGELEADEAAADRPRAGGRAEGGADASGVVEVAQHGDVARRRRPAAAGGAARAPVASSSCS